MKFFFAALIAVLFLSCQKETIEKSTLSGEVIESNGLLPLPCHAISFVTNYPIVAGKVPPFTFTKTQYSDGRIKTVNWIHRLYPNSSYYKPEYMVYKATITYGTNKAFISATSEYYRLDSYGSTPYSIGKRTFTVNFNSNGHAISLVSSIGQALISFGYSGKKMISMHIGPPSWEIGEAGYDVNMLVTTDSYGNITKLKSEKRSNGRIVELNYSYNYGISGKNYLYQPSQYVISPWYSFLELMEWVPKSIHERKSVGFKIDADFSSYSSTNKFILQQGQSYYNNKYDASGNLLSYTYADNVLQRTTWVCK